MERFFLKASAAAIAFFLFFLSSNSVFAQDGEDWLKRGSEALGKGSLNEAVIALTKAIRSEHRSADAYNNRGLAYYEMGRYAEAEEDFRKAVQLAPQSGQANNNLGLLLFEQGRYDEAVTCLNRALGPSEGVNPYREDILNNLSILYEKKGMIHEAEEIRSLACKVEDNQMNQREYGQKIDANGLTLKFYKH